MDYCQTMDHCCWRWWRVLSRSSYNGQSIKIELLTLLRLDDIRCINVLLMVFYRTQIPFRLPAIRSIWGCHCWSHCWVVRVNIHLGLLSLILCFRVTRFQSLSSWLLDLKSHLGCQSSSALCVAMLQAPFGCLIIRFHLGC